MGTTYGIHPDGSSDAEIVLDEMSNEFQLGIGGDVEWYNFSKKMTPEEALAMALRIVQVCLYWVEDSEETKRKLIEEVQKMYN